MRVLPDNNVDHRFARLLQGHDVIHARQMGWARLFNGDLICAAETENFAVMITADKNMRYQQNIETCEIALDILKNDPACGSVIIVNPLPLS